jgi:hypothetical protein
VGKFTLVPGASGALHDAAFTLEAEIFGSRYGVSYPDHVLEFSDYHFNSVLVSVVDEAGEVAGMMRWIVPGHAGLKTLNEAARAPWFIDAARAARAVGVDPERTWDVASLVVRPGLGSDRTTVTAALYHALALAVRRNGVRSLLMTVDERVRRILEVLGISGRALPGAAPLPFCGSPASTPVYGHCAEMWRWQRQVNPEAHRMIAHGAGLDVSVPATSSFLLSTMLGVQQAAAAALASSRYAALGTEMAPAAALPVSTPA